MNKVLSNASLKGLRIQSFTSFSVLCLRGGTPTEPIAQRYYSSKKETTWGYSYSGSPSKSCILSTSSFHEVILSTIEGKHGKNYLTTFSLHKSFCFLSKNIDVNKSQSTKPKLIHQGSQPCLSKTSFLSPLFCQCWWGNVQFLGCSSSGLGRASFMNS